MILMRAAPYLLIKMSLHKHLIYVLICVPLTGLVNSINNRIIPPFTPLQQTQYHRFSQMPVHSSYLFHIQSVPSVFLVAPLCTDMHSFPSPPAFHCQKAYWLYQEIPILQVYILDCSQLIYCMDLYSRFMIPTCHFVFLHNK